MAFGFLPPEVNSGLMYSGAGAGPLLAAAASWDSLAAELHAAAAGYSSVISGLASEGWLGPASASMAAAATPYMTWMSTTAAQAELTAGQARAAVAAYETAHTATVPPPVVATNRTELITLVATNVLGQNTPAIAANEALYAEMWAQDSTAMTGYAGAAASASSLPSFSQPPQTTNPAGTLGQAATSGQAAAGSVLTHAQTITSALPASSTTGSDVLTGLGQLTGITTPQQALSYGMMVPQSSNYLFGIVNAMNGLARSLSSGAGAAGAVGAASALSSAAGSGAAGLGGFGSLASSVTAGLGQSGTIGALSVPQAWAAASPLTSPIMGSTLSSSLSSALGSSSAGANASGMLNGMPMLANAAARGIGQGSPVALPRFDVRPSIIPITPAAG